MLLQREVPDHVNMWAASLAAAAGIPVMMDAGGDAGPLPKGMLQQLAVFSPNETELSRMTGA